MSSVQMLNLLNYLNGLGLTQDNKAWLAEHYFERSTEAKTEHVTRNYEELFSADIICQHVAEFEQEYKSGSVSGVDIEHIAKKYA